ncbi:MAG: hypothetical protein JKY70_09125 [Mucilaginibacter sp.]|nr:hypothetical protein [Mucilaginibacter sp.]
MKKLLLAAIACCAILSSCKTYQLNVISSTTKNPDEQTGNYQFENDTVRVTYSFYGENAPVNINIFNKLNEPLYVDWQKSALILGDTAISYVPNSVPINGDINAESYKYRYGNRNSSITTNPTYTTGTINATADLPKTTTFLPPHAQSNNTSLYLTRGFLNIPDDQLNSVKLKADDGWTNSTIKVRSAEFTPQNTPLAFRSYITMYILVDGEMVPCISEQQFFVSRSIKMSTNPNRLQDFSEKRGDYFINSKSSNAGQTIGVVALGALAVGAFATADSIKP